MKNIKLFNLKTAFAVIVLLISFNSIAKTITVSSASDITNALRDITAGDILLMKNGNWINQPIVLKAQLDKPFTLLAQTLGKVVLSGNSNIDIQSSFITIKGLYFMNGLTDKPFVVQFNKNVSNCRLTDCAIANYAPSDVKKYNRWISLSGTNNRIDHCLFKNKTGRGALLDIAILPKGNHHLIDSNYFGPRVELKANQGEIIRIGFGQPTSMLDGSTVVEHNYFEECDGEKEIISSKSSNNIFRFNTFFKCKGVLSLRQGNNSIVEGNYFLGENVIHTGGVKISGEGHIITDNYFSNLGGKNFMGALVFPAGNASNNEAAVFPNVKNITISNNTFIHNLQNVVVGVYYENRNAVVPPENVKFINNIFYNSKDTIVNQILKGKSFQWKKNIFFQGTPGIEITGDNKIEDPKLEQVSEGLYKLSVNSIARNANTADNIITDRKIQKQNLKNIGSNLLDSDTKPLSPKNIGLSWNF